MAEFKISALPEMEDPASGSDLVPIVDVSDTSTQPTGKTKKITVTDFASAIVTFLPYRIERAILTGKFLDLSGESAVGSMFLNPAGTKLFVLAIDADEVVQFTLSTPRDLATATRDGDFAIGTEEGFPASIMFNASGTRMYLCGSSGDDINQYNLGTAWEIVADPPTHAGVASVAAQTTAPNGVLISPDGTKMVVAGSTALIEYNLSTPYEVIGGSMSYSGVVTEGLGFSPSGMWWGEDRAGTPGGALFLCRATNSIAIRICPTPYRLTGSVSDPVIFDPPGTPGCRDVQFTPDGNKMWIIGTSVSGDGITEYHTSAAVPAA